MRLEGGADQQYGVSGIRSTLGHAARSSQDNNDRAVCISKYAAGGTLRALTMAEVTIEVLRKMTAAARAAKQSAEEVLRLTQKRESQALKALAEAPGPAEASAANSALLIVRRELAESAAAVVSAVDVLENSEADEREAAGEDERIPQTDYTAAEIVAKLHHYRQRATYAAVGGMLNAPPHYVRAWFVGQEGPDNSFVVSAKTREPTDYPKTKVHPSLKKSEVVLSTADGLLAWLQSHPLVQR